MCTKKTLYRAGMNPAVVVTPRKRGERSMNFRQVSFATDCLKMLANRRDLPISQLAEEMTKKGLFPRFYELLWAEPAFSKVQVVNRLSKILA